MKSRPSVALLIETSNSYARGLLRGIVSYIREHQSWSVHLPEQGRGATPPAWLSRWQGDGLIVRIENDVIARAVQNTGLPVVDVSAARLMPDVAWVETDDRAIARMAADHLLDKGFTHLAYCGDARFNWSNWRREQFVDYVRRRGASCSVFPARPSGRRPSWDRQQQRLREWVATLPRPVGVMACYDILAQQLLDACRDSNVAVPEEVAVIGVDNDELLCDLATPPLSSVIPDTVRTGYEAAALLDRMLRGESVAPRAHLIEPIGVATRQSTDVLALDDTDVAAAVRFIRENACENINVQNVLRVVPLSRRVLESRFRKLLGRTPHEEIVRLKIDRVKQLLRETDLSMQDIAQRAGFRHVEYMSVAFRKATGSAPTRYRRRS